tara:strand:+ start:66 stop:833 length:768 start_codon:yes stop_codon:yes gene_type:complete
LSKIYNSRIEDISSIFENIELSNNSIIVVHARIKSLYQMFDKVYSYSDITESIIDYFIKTYKPKTVLIPCYTYSFTQSGIYHNTHSKSEVGRFSEEARLLGYPRTNDPIFSFLDVNNFLRGKKIDYTIAFGDGSIFEYFHKEDAIILNIDLDSFIATQRHYVEHFYDVDYRYNKYFSGVIYSNDVDYKHVNYKYYVRDLDKQTNGNLKKINDDLKKEAILKTHYNNDLKISWLKCRPYLEFFKLKMEADNNYHIT